MQNKHLKLSHIIIKGNVVECRKKMYKCIKIPKRYRNDRYFILNRNTVKTKRLHGARNLLKTTIDSMVFSFHIKLYSGAKKTVFPPGAVSRAIPRSKFAYTVYCPHIFFARVSYSRVSVREICRIINSKRK